MNADSLEWKIISGYLESRLETLRAKNDNPAPLDSTNVLRGQIKEVKALLKLPDTLTAPGADSVHYVD